MFFYVLLVFRPCKGIAIRSATGYVALNSPRELQELDDFLCVKSKFKSKFRTERIDTNTDKNTGRNRDTNRNARMQKELERLKSPTVNRPSCFVSCKRVLYEEHSWLDLPTVWTELFLAALLR